MTTEFAIASAERKVHAIDKRIDAVRSELLRAAPVENELSPDDWQKSWDRNPVLRTIERDLYIRRWHAGRNRDNLLAEQARADERREVASYRKSSHAPCPACGQPTFAAPVPA
jgi:hypothetical protein